MRRNKRNRRGIVLVAVALALMLMIAGLGLGVDLNRWLVEQKSLQSTAEAVALSAVLELDGTPAGLERARVRAGATWRHHAPPSGATLTLEFAASAAGPFHADPLASADLRAARVHAHSSMPLILLRGVVQEKSLPVDGAATASQQQQGRVESGALPFAALPDGRLLEGLTVEADEAGAVRQAILSGANVLMKAGEQLPFFAGVPIAARQTLQEMVRSDSDPFAADYAAYTANGRGNGRRLVLMPVVDAERRITTFAAFLLLPAGEYQDDASVLRAEPIGGYLAGSRYRANAGSGAWRAEVIR